MLAENDRSCNKVANVKPSLFIKHDSSKGSRMLVVHG